MRNVVQHVFTSKHLQLRWFVQTNIIRMQDKAVNKCMLKRHVATRSKGCQNIILNLYDDFFRILYMKHETWVRYVIGEMKLMISFLLFNFFKCLFLTYYYVDGPESQMTIYNFCIGHNHNQTTLDPGVIFININFKKLDHRK